MSLPDQSSEAFVANVERHLYYGQLLSYLVGATIVIAFIYIFRSVLKLPKFERYKELHPEAKDRKGTPNCFNCQSSNIWMAPGMPATVHVCRVCGTRLWRS